MLVVGLDPCRKAGTGPGRDHPGVGESCKTILCLGRPFLVPQAGKRGRDRGFWALPCPVEGMRGQQWLCTTQRTACDERCRSQPDSPWLLGRLTSQLEVKMLVQPPAPDGGQCWGI